MAFTTDIGTETTISTPDAFTGELLSVSWDGIARGSVDVSHMGSVGARSFIPTDLYDPGTITLEHHFDPSEAPIITGAKGVFSITFPQSYVWGVDGFAVGFSISDPLEDKMVASTEIKASDRINRDGVDL